MDKSKLAETREYYKVDDGFGGKEKAYFFHAFFFSIYLTASSYWILCNVEWFCRGSAFPGASIAPEDKCLWDRNMRLAICGDFCVTPNVEGAIHSGLAAASRLRDILSCL